MQHSTSEIRGRKSYSQHYLVLAMFRTRNIFIKISTTPAPLKYPPKYRPHVLAQQKYGLNPA